MNAQQISNKLVKLGMDKPLSDFIAKRPCKPDCVKSSSKIRHNPLIYPHVGL